MSDERAYLRLAILSYILRGKEILDVPPHKGYVSFLITLEIHEGPLMADCANWNPISNSLGVVV
jgi:hypothetical protein